MITLPLDNPNIGYPKYNFILSKVFYKKKFEMNGSVFSQEITFKS